MLEPMRLRGKTGIILLAGLLLISSLAVGCSSDKKTPALPEASPSPSTTATPTPQVPAWTGSPTVYTKYGAVKGFEDKSETWVWKAIPYAKPPVDDLRWKAPRDPEPWEDIRESKDFCNMCIQYDALMGKEVWGTEDCLYLNIWRPRTEEKNLPVYVWIHGGGNTIGAANQTPTYMGSTVAGKSDMVFVSMNYRLGPFGWFTHPALRTGTALDDSGNYGTLDIIKSLEWIQQNIEAFGGDPNRVIVSGESAGAVNIFSLLMSPVAEGLFHSALIQSGMQASTNIEFGEESAKNVLMKLLVNDGKVSDTNEAEARLQAMSDAEVQTYLRAKTPPEIMECYEQRGFGMIDVPFIFADGSVIVDEGSTSFTTGNYPNKVPIIIGSNKEELKMFLFMNEELVRNEVLYQTVTSYGSKLWKVNGVDDICRKISAFADQPDIYAYQFNWGAYKEDGSSPIPAPYDLTVGAAHSLDNPFFLGNPSFNVIMTNWVFTEENRPGREALTDAMMKYVAQFARTGNPNTTGSEFPEWQPWENGENKPKCILFDADMDHAIIEMSNEELTVEKVMETMKAEVPAPLFSQAIDFISNEWTVSHLLENVEIDYTPPATPEPTKSPELTPTPEPAELAENATATTTYNVRYENEGTTEDTVWTITRTGEETIEGIDCYIAEMEFDQDPARWRYVESFNQDFPLTITGMTTWIDKNTSQPVKADSTAYAVITVTTTTTFTYDTPGGVPFETGKKWSYTEESSSMGMVLTSTFTVEVVGEEEVTVPAGSFDCYKVIHSSDSGDTITEWWTEIEGNPVAVKIIDEAHWNGVETRELASCISGD